MFISLKVTNVAFDSRTPSITDLETESDLGPKKTEQMTSNKQVIDCILQDLSQCNLE